MATIKRRRLMLTPNDFKGLDVIARKHALPSRTQAIRVPAPPDLSPGISASQVPGTLTPQRAKNGQPRVASGVGTAGSSVVTGRAVWSSQPCRSSGTEENSSRA